MAVQMSLIPGTVWKHWSSCDRKAERRPLDHFFVLSIPMYSITHSAYPLVTQRYLVRSWTVIALQCLSSSKPYFISLWPLKRNSKDAACTHVLWSVERWTHKNILREKTDIYLTVVAEYCCNYFILSKAETHRVWVLGTKLYCTRAVYTKCGAIYQIPN